MKIINWQTIKNLEQQWVKEHMKYSYLPKGLKITHKKPGFYWHNFLLFQKVLCIWQLLLTCIQDLFWTGIWVLQWVRTGVPEFCGNNRKYGVLKYSIQIKEVNIPVRFTKMLLDNGAKISMDGKDMRLTTFYRTYVGTVQYENIYQSLYRWTESLRGT
jgi:hypothetical protein